MSKVFSIFDSKAEAYLQPFFAQTAAVAIRQFESAVRDESSQFNKHAADYTLFEIGDWNEESGTLLNNHANVNLGCAIEFINREE